MDPSPHKIPLLAVQGKNEAAGPLYDRSLAIREKALGPDHPAVAESLHNRAVLLSNEVRAVRKLQEISCGVRWVFRSQQPGGVVGEAGESRKEVPGKFLWYPIDFGSTQQPALLEAQVRAIITFSETSGVALLAVVVERVR